MSANALQQLEENISIDRYLAEDQKRKIFAGIHYLRLLYRIY